jgi:hypothetical protein
MRPRGKTGKFRTMPRFVILEHDHPTLHWDLMLEVGLVLRTWRLEAPPRDAESITATAIFDHRLLYLDYEGPVSGGRGRVTRWERGTFTGEVGDKSPILVQLQGEHFQGVLRLEQIEGDSWRASVLKSEPEA